IYFNKRNILSHSSNPFHKPQNSCVVFITIIGLTTRKFFWPSLSDTEMPLFYQNSESDNEEDEQS
ncbi:4428_t:CDS:2, partial [Scutellospora calospora]